MPLTDRVNRKSYHLFIVESPGKTRKIEQYLGAGWTVKASFGDDIARSQSPYLSVVRDGHAVLMEELSHLPAAPRQAPRVRSAVNTHSSSLSDQEPCGTCRCGGEIVERPKSWTCAACQATVWKTSFGKKFTLKQAQGLLSGKVIALKGLKSKAGKKYDAKAVMEEGKVKLIFDTSPNS
jgi:ribosomal protein L37AE/L43A